ncbi:hypothetical protein N7512_009617 [Penicillium capsulatum]|nr:hypothetical protein N7512_009617 [Penicillium capsulatum]
MAAAACMGCIKNVTPLHLPNGSKPNARGIAPPLARGGCKIISAPRANPAPPAALIRRQPIFKPLRSWEPKKLWAPINAWGAIWSVGFRQNLPRSQYDLLLSLVTGID